MKKRWGSFLLAVCMIVSLMIPVVGAENEDSLRNYVVSIRDPKPEGVTVNLFDYWVKKQDENDSTQDEDIVNQGINKDHTLKFRKTAIKTGEYNNWTGSAKPYSGIVKNVLGADGYPVLNETIGDESLAYLFNGKDGEGKKAYMDVGGLLKKKEGYHYYNSQDNFASYDEATNDFILYNTWGVKTGGSSPNGQFFPFNKGEEVFEIAENKLQQKDIKSTNPAIHHYFGISMSTRFVQVEGGTLPNDRETPVTYEFSGDDDVWIFIDDVLVADLGGIHDAATVKINFSTGKIMINEGKKDKEGTSIAEESTLKEKFKAAGKEDSTSWSGDTFADNTYHTLKFFYLERGNTDSNMYLRFNLVTRLESEIVKVDQDGAMVAGAEFALYQANSNYEIEKETPYAIGTTDDNGEFILEREDGLPLLLSDLQEKSDYWVLQEKETPEGYRGVGDIHLYCEKVRSTGGDGAETKDGYPILLSGNAWDVGAYAMAKVMTTAKTSLLDENGQKKWVPLVTMAEAKDGMEVSSDGTKVAVTDEEGEPKGSMFAVILKKGTEKPLSNSTLDDLTAIYGEPVEGWNIAEKGMDGVIQSARENWYPFELNESYQFVSTIENIPGDIKNYYLLAENKDMAEYTGGYFYSTAEKKEDICAENTVMLDPTNFERQFAVKLYVPNIENRLLVQKTDEEGNPLDGAKFALYKQSDVTITDGTYTITIESDGSEANPVQMSQETGTIAEGVNGEIKGAATFSKIPKGEYYLIETEAPAGFEKNLTAVPVVVDDTGVYADAGDENDMVSVNLGVGKLVKSMVQFATDDGLDATLHGVKAVLETGTYEEEKGLTWNGVDETVWSSKDPEKIMYLSYSSSDAVLEYGPIPGSDNILTYDEGWGRLSIQQYLEDEIQSPKQDLETQSLNNLFSGTTMVVVGNQRQAAGKLSITKNVAGLDEDIASQLSFDITLTAEPKNLNGGTVYRMKDGETSEKVPFSEEGKATLSIHDGETITLQVPAGVTITVKENASENFEVAYETQTGDETTREKSGSVTIQEGEESTVTITNTLKNPSAVSLVPKITKQFTGSGWSTGDEVSFQIKATGENKEGTPVPNPDQITITKSSDSTASASFAPIIFTEAGTYQYEITEDEGDLNRVKYDTSVYTFSVTVTDNEERGLTVSNWSIKKNGKPADEIVFTNHRSSGSHRPDPDPDDDKPSLNTQDHYGYIIGYPVDYYTGLPTEDQTKKPVKPQGNITRAEVATIYFRMLTDESRNHFWSQDSGYPDVALADWFNNAIATLSNGGIISGYPDGTFDPNGYITRAEFAVIAARFFDMDYQGEDLFPDIDGHWAQDYINPAAENGFIEGYPDGTFGPDKYITRAEAVTLVNRTLDRHPDPDHFLEDMLVWPDNLDTEQWYYADMQEATNSHEYQVKKDAQGNEYEVWTKVLPVRDWEAFEKEWSDANSAENPGEVVGKN